MEKTDKGNSTPILLCGWRFNSLEKHVFALKNLKTYLSRKGDTRYSTQKQEVSQDSVYIYVNSIKMTDVMKSGWVTFRDSPDSFRTIDNTLSIFKRFPRNIRFDVCLSVYEKHFLGKFRSASINGDNKIVLNTKPGTLYLMLGTDALSRRQFLQGQVFSLLPG